MNYWFVFGRIPYDDDDTGYPVGQHKHEHEAIAAYKARIIKERNIEPEHIEAMEKDLGTAVYINGVVCSESEIKQS